MNATYVALELRRMLRNRPALFFVVGLPGFMYLMFGTSEEDAGDRLANGNVAMYVMVSMAAYGALSATTGISGMAAVERLQGWGRQLGLTPLRDGGYVAMKSIVALARACLPVAVVFVLGAVTAADAPAVTWVLCAAVVIAGALTCSLFGLAIGLALPTESSVSVAGGMVVVLAFAGNLFIELSGVVLTIAKFTPLYGYAALARYPIHSGRPGDADWIPADPLWQPTLNVVVWTILFGAFAVAMVRHAAAGVTAGTALLERHGWATAAVWLAFLAFPVEAAVTADRPPLVRIAGIAALGAIAVLYLHGLIRMPDDRDPHQTERHGLRHLAPMVVLAGAVSAIVGPAGLVTLAYVVAVAMFTLRSGAAIAVAVAAIAAPPALTAAGAFEDGTEYSTVYIAMAALFTGLIRLIGQRDATRLVAERELGVVTERERVARDVHDVLGHTLTVLATKAELAARMIDLDPQRTRDELLQIQSLSRESLTELHATVAGMRVARLGAEIDAARATLTAAGIEPDLPPDADGVDPRHRMTLAWVLRESITNVVRHSGARTCRVTLSTRSMMVADDGLGRHGTPEGDRLRGLRERVTASGGHLGVGAGPDGRGTVVEVHL